MKKFLLLGMLTLCLIMLFACSDSKDKKEVTTSSTQNEKDKDIIQIAEEKMKIASEIERLFRGIAELESHDYAEIEPQDNGFRYVPFKNSKYSTLKAMEEVLFSVHTKQYIESTYGDYITGTMVREINGRMCLNIDVGGAGGTEWLTDTLEIISEEAEIIVVSMEYMDIYENKGFAKVEFKLIEDKWLINSISEIREQ